MSSFLSSSIGKKLIMSISGLFLIVFLIVHLSINLLIFDSTGELYNAGAEFMATNPLIKIMEPVLAIGFLIHIIYATVLTLQNQKATPQKYAIAQKTKASSWASKNMWILGALVFVFILLHMGHFFVKMKIDNADFLAGGHDSYALVTALFQAPNGVGLLMCGLYSLAAILLGLHLQHGFWSGFQSMGLNNQIWMKRLQKTATVFAILIAIGYAVLPLYMTFVLK